MAMQAIVLICLEYVALPLTEAPLVCHHRTFAAFARPAVPLTHAIAALFPFDPAFGFFAFGGEHAGGWHRAVNGGHRRAGGAC